MFLKYGKSSFLQIYLSILTQGGIILNYHNFHRGYLHPFCFTTPHLIVVKKARKSWLIIHHCNGPSSFLIAGFLRPVKKGLTFAHCTNLGKKPLFSHWICYHCNFTKYSLVLLGVQNEKWFLLIDAAAQLKSQFAQFVSVHYYQSAKDWIAILSRLGNLFDLKGQ